MKSHARCSLFARIAFVKRSSKSASSGVKGSVKLCGGVVFRSNDVFSTGAVVG